MPGGSRRKSADRDERIADLAVDLRGVRAVAERVLHPAHPLLLVLRRTPDTLRPGELLPRLDDWAVLLEVWP